MQLGKLQMLQFAKSNPQILKSSNPQILKAAIISSQSNHSLATASH